MKKYICILASAALLAACEQKTETVAPSGSPAATASPEATTAASPEATIPATESPAASPASTP